MSKKLLAYASLFGLNGFLLLVLFALLGGYGLATLELSSYVYTQPQRDFISSNERLNLSQMSPVWNWISPGGESVPAELTDWTTHIQATLRSRYEEYAGVSATVYALDFQSVYSFTYPGPALTTTAEFIFAFPGNLDTLNNVDFQVDGRPAEGVTYSAQNITWRTTLNAGAAHQIAIQYRANGASSFSYSLSRNQRSNVNITLVVLGPAGSQAPRQTLPPTDVVREAGSETFVWRYPNLIPTRDLQIDLPQRLSFTQRVAALQDSFSTLALLAPFAIGLCLISLAALLHGAGLRLRLTAYLLAGCSLGLFYPGLTFLSGLAGIVWAAPLAWLLTTALVLGLLGLAAGWRQTWWRGAWVLFICQGIVTVGILTPWSGPLLTLSGLLLLGTFIAVYARRLIAPPPAIAPAEPTAPDTPAPPASHHCPRCGRALAADHAYCPGCGYDAHTFRHCPRCAQVQFIPPDIKSAHCLSCGESLPG